MLNAGAQTAKRQTGDKANEAAAPADEEIAGRRRRCTGGEQKTFADAFREEAGGDLQTGHDPGIDSLEKTYLRQCQAELGLPNRQQHVEKIGEAVVQNVRAQRRPEDAARRKGRGERIAAGEGRRDGRHASLSLG